MGFAWDTTVDKKNGVDKSGSQIVCWQGDMERRCMQSFNFGGIRNCIVKSI